MKNILTLGLIIIVIAGCSTDDANNNEMEEDLNSIACESGDTCAATVATDETEATLPTNTVGIYETTYTIEEPGSPFELGTEATFEITQDQELIVAVVGFDCITLSNPIWRFGADASSGNYKFKDQCRDMIAYNVSFNTDGTFSEVNIEVVDSPGFFGQFSL